ISALLNGFVVGAVIPFGTLFCQSCKPLLKFGPGGAVTAVLFGAAFSRFAAVAPPSSGDRPHFCRGSSDDFFGIRSSNKPPDVGGGADAVLFGASPTSASLSDFGVITVQAP